jgi:hypothetical protein
VRRRGGNGQLFGLVLIGVGAAGLAQQFTVLTSTTLASGVC